MTPTFSTKHYKRLAQWLCDMKFAASQQSEAAIDIAAPLADMLQADNIRFDRDKFFKHVYKLYTYKLYMEACDQR
jgi:hypothetical protein